MRIRCNERERREHPARRTCLPSECRFRAWHHVELGMASFGGASGLGHNARLVPERDRNLSAGASAAELALRLGWSVRPLRSVEAAVAKIHPPPLSLVAACGARRGADSHAVGSDRRDPPRELVHPECAAAAVEARSSVRLGTGGRRPGHTMAVHTISWAI